MNDTNQDNLLNPKSSKKRWWEMKNLPRFRTSKIFLFSGMMLASWVIWNDNLTALLLSMMSRCVSSSLALNPSLLKIGSIIFSMYLNIAHIHQNDLNQSTKEQIDRIRSVTKPSLCQDLETVTIGHHHRWQKIFCKIWIWQKIFRKSYPTFCRIFYTSIFFLQ